MIRQKLEKDTKNMVHPKLKEDSKKMARPNLNQDSKKLKYPQVKFPKKITEKWLDKAFAPLKDYLMKERPDEVKQIMAYVMFMGNVEQRFFYRNYRTRGYIEFDQSGNLIRRDDDALQYQFDDPQMNRVVQQPTREERFIHPNVSKWISKNLTEKQSRKYGEEVRIFLQVYWGPIVNYDFSDLIISYPKRGKRVPYCLYIYPANFDKLIAVQFVGDEIVEMKCKLTDYRLYEQRQRDLSFEGWHVVTIIKEVLEEDPELFRLYLSKAIEMAEYRDPVYELTASAWRNFD